MREGGRGTCGACRAFRKLSSSWRRSGSRSEMSTSHCQEVRMASRSEWRGGGEGGREGCQYDDHF